MSKWSDRGYCWFVSPVAAVNSNSGSPLFMTDYVRLHADLSPPHWKRSAGDKWDAGYATTAYFLDWLEQRYGDGTIREINLAMKNREYENLIFQEATGRKVEKLWKIYREELRQGDKAC